MILQYMKPCARHTHYTLIHADYSGRISILAVKALIFFVPKSWDDALADGKSPSRGASDCRNAACRRCFSLSVMASRLGPEFRIYRNWTRQLWRAPDLSESFDPDQIELTLRTVSLVPDEVLLELDGRFGAKFRGLSELSG